MNLTGQPHFDVLVLIARIYFGLPTLILRLLFLSGGSFLLFLVLLGFGVHTWNTPFIY